MNALTVEVKFLVSGNATYQELLRALIEIHQRPRRFGPLRAGSRRLSQGPGSAVNSPRHGEVEHTRRLLAQCRIARIRSSASLVSSKGNSTEEAHSRPWRLNLTSEKKAAREEPPFLAGTVRSKDELARDLGNSLIRCSGRKRSVRRRRRELHELYLAKERRVSVRIR
jgi:hypothetical protein